MVPCPRCEKCYDCKTIPQFRINCPQVCIESSSFTSINDNLSIENSTTDNSDNIPIEETIEVDIEKNEKKTVKCPSCENCIDCDESPEYIDVCPSVCISKTPEEEECPTCIGCIDCNKHPKYIQECPEVCKASTQDDDSVQSIVCPDCINCIDCSGRPTLIEYCSSVCKTDEYGLIIDNGGDSGTFDCPTCENCVDCNEHPEYLMDCPGVCFDPEADPNIFVEEEPLIEEPSIEEPTITCPICRHCANCDETPIYKEICPDVCMTEKEIKQISKKRNKILFVHHVLNVWIVQNIQNL